MIKNPWAILLVLIVIESSILYLAAHPKLKKFFTVIPHIFWIYFLPMVVSSLGWIDPKSILYTHITNWILPMSLAILLMTVDIKSILRLGPTALGMFVIGSVSVGIGMTLAFGIFHPVIGTDYWSGFGALTGSWTGGSANMIAVKEALSTPDEVFLPLVVVDAILPYLWMGLLITMASHQKAFDAWNKSDPKILKDLSERMESFRASSQAKNWRLKEFIGILLIGIACAAFAKTAAQFLPAVKSVFSSFTWVIVAVSVSGLMLSYTPVRKLEHYNSNAIGYFLLYLVLTTIGAKANLTQLGQFWTLMLVGILVISVHAVGLLISCRIFKAPLCLAAAASQANLGGVASAPLVAEIYCKGLAPLGLLLAIFGNIIGTYIGILTAQICRLWS